MLLSQGPERKGNLEIREPIQDLKDSESGSNKTLTTRDTATTSGEFKFQDVERWKSDNLAKIYFKGKIKRVI